VYRLLFAGLLGAILAASQLSAQTNPITEGTTNAVTSTNDPAEVELDQLMTEDDAAMDEVDAWIRTNSAQTNGGTSNTELNQRINTRLSGVREKYENFLERYPDYEPGHMAYGSFLDDLGNEDLAFVEFETSSELDPKDPAAWNNLANYFGEHGSITNAFADYQKAIDLDPSEALYYQNLATTVYLFRPDARAFYGITEQQVFDKSLALYQKAVQLDPKNFELASDYAETYYGIKPLRTNDALVAWTNALTSAQTEVEREGVYIHLARIKYLVGRYDEARAQLEAVTNSTYDDLKNRIERNIKLKENPPTNAVPVSLQATNAVMTNAVPALTNPPPILTNEASVLTNVPPVTPPPAPIQATNPPENPTNLLNNLEVTPPGPRPPLGQD
jgi:tetratricopeptide (TPR) repeat protein